MNRKRYPNMHDTHDIACSFLLRLRVYHNTQAIILRNNLDLKLSAVFLLFVMIKAPVRLSHELMISGLHVRYQHA